MEIKIINNKIEIWETGRQNNELIYESNKSIHSYKRGKLANFELLLRKQKILSEADKIKKYLGKVIRSRFIPELIPTNNDVANVRLSYLKEEIDRHIKEDNLDLNPDFQRGHVWNYEQRVRYLEFIFQGGKTSPIWFNHEGWMSTFEGEMVVVDGLQRLTSLLMFLNNEIPIFKNLDDEGVGYYASEFDCFGIDILIGINNLPSRKLVLQWYYQLNAGYIQHSQEELDKVKKMISEEN